MWALVTLVGMIQGAGPWEFLFRLRCAPGTIAVEGQTFRVVTPEGHADIEGTAAQVAYRSDATFEIRLVQMGQMTVEDRNAIWEAIKEMMDNGDVEAP